MPKRILEGNVVSSYQKTLVVVVSRRVKHPKYKKIVTISKKYYAHDENSEYKKGDVVTIVESRPISKLKKWVVVSKAS